MKYAEQMPQMYPWHGLPREILAAAGKEIDALYAGWEHILEQLYIQTANDGLSWWEKDLGILYAVLGDTEERRIWILTCLRGSSLPILDVMRSIEPSITLSFGGWVLPFTVEVKANQDEYDFGRLIVVLEKYKPAHLSYTFRYNTPDPGCGYAIIGSAPIPNIHLSPESGAFYAGRWPRWNTRGFVNRDAIVPTMSVKTGRVNYDYSGIGRGARAVSNAKVVYYPIVGLSTYRSCGISLAAGQGAVITERVSVYMTGTTTGASPYPFAGVSVGVVRNAAAALFGVGRCGARDFRSCGTFRVGEVI